MKSISLNQQKPFEILVVDDTADSLELLAELLSGQGYHIHPAYSGELALQSIKAAKPDLILLDVKMTGMNGYEICILLKNDDSTCEIPVIFISALDDELSKVKGFEVGGVDFISKPFRKEEVLARVKTHLELHQLQHELKTRNQLLEDEVVMRKFAANALQESEERFRTTLYSIGDGVITTDVNGQVVMMNWIAENLTGWKQEDATGKMLEDVFEIVNEETLEPVEIPIRKVIREGVIVGLANHTVLISKDGTQRPIADSGAPIKNAEGKITGVVLVFHDQTEERKISSELEASERKFRSIVESSPMGMYFYKLQPDGKLVFDGANPAADKIIGTDHSKYIGKTIQEAFPNLGNTNVPEMYSKVAKGEMNTQQFEIEYHDEQQINGFYSVTAFQSGKNFVTIQFIDISEQKNAELALKISEEQFRRLFEHATVGFSMTMTDGTININQAFCNMLGYEPSELKQINWKTITHPDDIQESIDVIELLKSGKENQHRYEKRYIHKNGTVIWADVSTTLMRNDIGEPLYFITNINDITKRKLTEEKLLRSERELNKAQQITHIGSWYLDLNTNEVFWTEELYKMYGFDPKLPVPPYTEHKKLFTTESWELLSESLENTAKTGIPYELELKTVRKDGGKGWMWVRGETVKDSKNNTIGLWGAAQDITTRKNADQALFESEEMMRNSQAVAHICSYSTNLNVKKIETSSWKCSPEFYKIFGIDNTYPHTIEGWIGFIHPDYREEMVAYHEFVIKKRIPFEHEYKIIRINDGAERWVYGTGKLEFDEKGNPVRMHGAIQDITERKISEEIISKERSLLRTLIDHLPNTVYVKDLEGRKIIANKADREYIGKSFPDIMKKTDIEVFGGDIGQHGFNDDMRVMQTGEPMLDVEENFIDNNGEKRWLVTSKIPLRDSSGKVYGLVGTGRDITNQHRDHETIQKLTMSIEQSPSSIVITDTQGAIQYVNPKFTEITGYTPAEAVGKNPKILKSDEMSAENYKAMWDIISMGGVWRGEFHNKKKNGELYWEWATITSIKNDNGEIINYIAIKEDISQRKQMENELIVAKEKAEENDRLKSAFLANMSHEIRTPLNCILGFTDLITDPTTESEERLGFSKLINTAGNNLLSIINDIIDISKIESGQLQLNRSKFPIQKIIKEVATLFQNKAAEQGVLLSVSPNLFKEDIVIEGDEDKLRQVLTNFVSNALKFTEKGSIEIGAKNMGDTLQLFVHDTGIGIRKEFHENIFERFRQLETSHTRKYGGNGLGLAISKSLIEFLGGTIGMESEPGKGSTFYFTLPLKQ